MADIARVKVLSVLAGVEIGVKELVEDWLLLTYDIPGTKQGSITRRKFLSQARRIGAQEHTASVYLLPWTPEAEVAALDVATIGRAFLWFSKVEDEKRARELTYLYDQFIARRISQVSNRVDKIGKHIRDRKFKLAQKMAHKTVQMLKDLILVVARRGSPELGEKLSSVVERLNDLLRAV